MKKIILLANLTILVTLAACSPNQMGAQPVQESVQPMEEVLEKPLASRLPEAYRSLLPEGTEIPSQLPGTIEDPTLLAAWIIIYNQVDPITIQDHISLTGRDLALTVIERSIAVQWGDETICNGNSCARRSFCEDLDCIASYNPEEIYPIFITQDYKDTQKTPLTRLAGSLAHELFHHNQPFGPVASSLYEEYWAFYIGAQVEGASWPYFQGYDPLNQACLMRWFQAHAPDEAYKNNPAYPMTLSDPVDMTSEGCKP